MRQPKKRYQKLSAVRKSSADYRKLISEKSLLKVQQRARGIGVDLVSVDFDGMELRFRTQSTTVRGKFYTEIIQFSELEPSQIVEGRNLAQILRSAKLKVYSNDPAYLYWGYAYKCWRYGCGLYPETRFPKVRNPRLRGWVSKHLYAVLMTFPFIAPQIAKQLRKYWTEKQEKEFSEKLQKISKDIKLDDLLDA